MKKNIALILSFILLVSAFTLGGCGKTDNTPVNSSKEKSDDLYITFTVTSKGEGEDSFESATYYYDLKTDKTEKIATVPYTSQYPLTAYDKANNIVYYSSKNDKKHQDELFSYDVESKKSTMLTNSIYALNYIFPTSNGVLLGIVPAQAPVVAVRPFVFNSSDGTLKDLTWDSDLHFNKMSYNPQTGKIIGSCFSASEQIERIANQETVPYGDSVNYVYSIDEKGHKKLFSNDKDISLIFADDNGVWYGSDKENMNFYSYETNKSEKYTLPEKILKTNISNIIYITPENNDVYYIGSGDTGEGTTLYHYQSKSDALTTIYSAKLPPQQELNNAFILKK